MTLKEYFNFMDVVHNIKLTARDVSRDLNVSYLHAYEISRKNRKPSLKMAREISMWTEGRVTVAELLNSACECKTHEGLVKFRANLIRRIRSMKLEDELIKKRIDKEIQAKQAEEIRVEQLTRELEL